MSQGVIGFGGFIGLAEEVTFGTAVTPSTHWVPIVRSTLGQVRTIRRREDLQAYRPSPPSTVGRDMLELGIDVSGEIEIVPQYNAEWMGALLEYALGAIATTGSDPFNHTATLDFDGPTGAGGKSLTIQQVRGQHPSLNLAEVFRGCVVNTWELRVDARGEARMILGLLGVRSNGPGAISGTASFPAGEEILAHHAALLGFNSATHQCVSLSVKYDKKLSVRPFVGSQYSDYMQPSAMAEVTVNATLEHINDALYDAYIAGATGDVTLDFTGAGGSTPGDHGLDITVHNGRITSMSRPVDGVGVLRQTVTWMGSADATNGGLEVILQNNNSAHM